MWEEGCSANMQFPGEGWASVLSIGREGASVGHERPEDVRGTFVWSRDQRISLAGNAQPGKVTHLCLAP
jgi:hypothetical protein